MHDMKLWEKFYNHLLNEAVTKNRVAKLKQMFATCERGLKKGLENADREQIESFITKLNTNKFKRRDGKPYTGSSKADIKKFLRQFYKWYRGNNETYPPEVSWIKSRISKDEQPREKPVISLEELYKLANSFTDLRYKTLVLTLFDSGFRIQELLSVKKKHFTWESFTDEEECFWISCSESKTLTRKIPIPLFTEDLQQFYNSTYFKTLKPESPLFDMSYSAICKALSVNGQKVTGKHLSPHAFRHSSATYYAKEYDGNMQLIAQRYGWSFSSKELQTYIRRSGAYQKAGAKKSFENEVVKLRKEMEHIKGLLRKVLSNPEKTQQLSKKVQEGLK